MKIVKQKLKKASDPYKALLAYRATPLENGYSPAELLFGRRLRTTVPTSPELLLPRLPDDKQLKGAERLSKHRQAFNYNRRHRAKELPELLAGTPVWITDLRCYGTVANRDRAPRSYWILTDSGHVRRNRRFLIENKNGSSEPQDDTSSFVDIPVPRVRPPDTEEPSSDVHYDAPVGPQASSSQEPYRTRYGRIVKPPPRN